jgi:hypothetical protein
MMEPSLYEKFTSNQNKALIWNLLSNDGAFNSIPDSQANRVKEEFDRKVETISIQLTPADNLVNLDKRVISEMLKELKKYAKPKPSDDMTLNYNAADIAQKRQKVFEEELKTKKKEFDVFNNTPTPDKINFSDNLDTPMGSEMDKILAEQIALREKQLNMVLQTQDKEAATKWIQNPGDVVKTEEPAKLKIGENVQLDIKEPSLKAKKVNFADNTTTDNDNFLSLLKKKQEPAEESLTLLREILEKQNQILTLLTKNRINF